MGVGYVVSIPSSTPNGLMDNVVVLILVGTLVGDIDPVGPTEATEINDGTSTGVPGMAVGVVS